MLRAAALAAMTFALVFVVTALTDEGGVPWAVRLSRSLPAVPLAGAVGAGLAFRSARVRGELLALEALGRSPWQSGAYPALGAGLVIGAVALAVALAPRVDVEGFYPSAYRGDDLRPEAGGFVDAARRYRVDAEGRITFLEKASEEVQAPAGVPPRGRSTAVAAVLFAGVALARLVTTGERWRRRDTAAVVAFLVTSALLFHAAALRRVSAPWAALPAAALLAWAAFGYRPRHE